VKFKKRTMVSGITHHWDFGVPIVVPGYFRSIYSRRVFPHFRRTCNRNRCGCFKSGTGYKIWDGKINYLSLYWFWRPTLPLLLSDVRVLLLFSPCNFFSMGSFSNIRAMAMQPVGHIAGTAAAVGLYFYNYSHRCYIGRNQALPLLLVFNMRHNLGVYCLFKIDEKSTAAVVKQ
jgi:hypothetical protein